MPYETRTPYTAADRQRLAEYLFTFPERERTKIKTFERAGARLPGHSVQSWHEHYRKTGREDVNRRIAILARKAKRGSEASKADKKSRKASAQVDELDSGASEGDGDERAPVASTSAIRLPDRDRTDRKGKRRGAVPVPSDDDDAGESDDDSRQTKVRADFTEEDFDICVELLARKAREGFSNKQLYAQLVEQSPDHTVFSWQTWISKHRRELDEALEHRSAEQKRRGREEKRRQSDERDSRSGSSRPTSAAAEAAPSGKTPRAREAPKPDRAAALVQAAAPTPRVLEVKPEQPRRPQGKPDKGKARALSPRPRSVSKGTSRAGAGEAEERFSDEDKHLLVHQYARALLRDWDTDNVFVYLGQQHAHHSEAAWRKYWKSNLGELLSLASRRVQQVEEAQAAKRRRESAEEDEEADEGSGQEEGQDGDEEEAEEDRRRDEQDENVARDAEERFRREEEEASERQARVVLSAGPDPAAAGEKAPVARAASSEQAGRRGRYDEEGFDAPSSSPEVLVQQSGSSDEPAQWDRTAMSEAGTPVKQEARTTSVTSLVPTPRHTPPGNQTGSQQIVPATLPPSSPAPVLDQEEEEHVEVAASSSPASTLPHHSQYSVLPSPFVHEVPLASDDQMLVDDDDVKDEPSDEDAELVVSRVQPEQEELFRLDGSSDRDEGDMWNELDSREHDLIQDLHELVSLVQQQEARAAAPQSVASPVAAPEPAPAQPLAPPPVEAREELQVREPPRSSPSKKRPRERSPSAPSDQARDNDEPIHDHKRRKLEPAQPVRPTEPAVRRARHSAPHALPAGAPASPAETPARRVPRASDAAATGLTSSAPRPGKAPSVDVVERSSPQAADAAPPDKPPTAARVAAAAAPGTGNPPKRSLAEDIANHSRRYGLPQQSIKNLMFCSSARDGLEELLPWFAPAHRPPEGSAEHERLRQLVQQEVWSYRDDMIVLAGSDSARKQLAAKRGEQAIRRRKRFLARARMDQVGALRKDLYDL